MSELDTVRPNGVSSDGPEDLERGKYTIDEGPMVVYLRPEWSLVLILLILMASSFTHIYKPFMDEYSSIYIDREYDDEEEQRAIMEAEGLDLGSYLNCGRYRSFGGYGANESNQTPGPRVECRVPSFMDQTSIDTYVAYMQEFNQVRSSHLATLSYRVECIWFDTLRFIHSPELGFIEMNDKGLRIGAYRNYYDLTGLDGELCTKTIPDADWDLYNYTLTDVYVVKATIRYTEMFDPECGLGQSNTQLIVLDEDLNVRIVQVGIPDVWCS